MIRDPKPEEAESDDNRFEAARLEDPLKSLRLRPPVKVSLGSELIDAIQKMRESGVGSCLIEDGGGVLAGILTERDLLNKIPFDGAGLGSARVDDFMHANPETLTPDHPIAYALNRMAGAGYRNLPLVDAGGCAVGLVTLRDIVEDICEHFSEEVLCIPPTRRAAIAKEREGA
jgi:CBS domain-containing protein